MLSPNETAMLLSDLYTRLGFCLPPDAQEQLTEAPPSNVDGFTAAVFIAEGLDPSADRRLYREVKTMVADAFRRNEEREGNA